MKPYYRHVLYSTGLAAALVAVPPVAARSPDLRLDAATHEGQITQLNAQLLEQAQFAHRPLDDAMAAEFLDGYLDSLDGSRELLTQADVNEFRRVLPYLADATLGEGNTRSARAIFERYLERTEERATFVEKALAEETFDFTGSDRYAFDRDDATRPADAAAARELWRQRLRADVLQERLGDKNPEDFSDRIARRYRRQAETMKNLSADAVLEIYLNALAHAYDPHSAYMGREQLASFNISMKLSLAGVGAMLGSDGDYCEIRELVPGGPAERSGKLDVGDKIVAAAEGVGGEPVDLFNYPIGQIVDLIRGPKGSDVTLTIIPSGATEDVRESVTITRDEIHLEDQEAKARIIDFPSGGRVERLGVIDLPAFYGDVDGKGHSATTDVARLITKLEGEGVRGIILDLRRNGGGSLEEAINLTGLFIPSGAVVQTRDLSGRTRIGADEDGRTLYDGPLVVLTSRFSASASEIVAGALQDYGRALVVGDSSTFGKGTVQTILPLGDIMESNGVSPDTDPGALKVTISMFYRPGGSSTQLRGVRPDIVLPSFTDDPEISEAGMDNALPWDSVAPARYPRYRMVDPFVPALASRSRDRIAADEDFASWLQDLALVEKNRATRSVSLNETERRQERDDAEVRNEARKAARDARSADQPPVYEITLKDLDLPGLPAPVAPGLHEGETTDGRGTGDLLLEETQHILSDYVRLLEPETQGHGPTTALTR
jgi:carboxyl-terminal processing protease